MKSTSVKGLFAKGMILAVAAGALIAASPIKAEAQHFAVAIGVGNPYYAQNQDYGRYDRGDRYARGDDRYDRYDRGDDRYDRYAYARQEEFNRRQEFERRQAYYRHEEWERMHRDDRPYGYR